MYEIRISDGPQSGGYTDEASNKREALRIAREAAADRYENSSSATVYRVEKNGDRTPVAAYENINGLAVKVNVGGL